MCTGTATPCNTQHATRNTQRQWLPKLTALLVTTQTMPDQVLTEIPLIEKDLIRALNNIAVIILLLLWFI
jgi:hypothetical protein